MKDQLINCTRNAFQKHFNQVPDYIFLSPGRINIIGEHVDYNDGYVLPAAIDKYICLAIRKNSESNDCKIFSYDLNESFSFKINEKIEGDSPMWVKYLLGVAEEIRKTGKRIEGMEVVFSGNIPMGAGLSSSAALECGFAYALNSIFNLNFTKKEVVLIGQRSENQFVGVQCGVMDQFASVFGQKDKAVMLSCDSLDYQYYDAKMDGCSFILLDSRVKHTHLTSGYNDRRKEVEKGKKIIHDNFNEMETFRDCTHEMLDSVRGELGEIIYKRCLYIIEEIKRVEVAAKAIYNQDFKLLGELLNQTHFGLSKQYEVSCPEIDFLVEETIKMDGVLGARMMGGGFGGCSINLIKNENVAEVTEKIKKIYKSAYHIDLKIYEVKISDGTKEYKENEYSI
ncbi:galactokinase [Chryseobacterium sp. MMS23-Vi53]|uniref:galactokinase n=1 Tax=Chryseobacterium sp. MMS23-Vi53 TaxID=3386644 RepID=UPI0039ED1B62